MRNVICLKWGTRYPSLYVNRLYNGVKRHMKGPFRFVCFTNEPEGLVEGIEVRPIPARPPNVPERRVWPSVFTKLTLFKDGCGDLSGPTLFLDIDQVIVGDMNRFFDYKPGEFCIIHNWIEFRKRIFRRRPDIGNSSCFRFEAGKMNRVWEAFDANMAEAYDKSKFATEQAFMTYAVGLDKVNWWPEGWVCSFKRHLMRAFPFNLFKMPKYRPGASILCFHGEPDPVSAISGFAGHHNHLNEKCLPTPWVEDLWQGLDDESLEYLGDGSRRICYRVKGDDGIVVKFLRRPGDPHGDEHLDVMRELDKTRFDSRKNLNVREAKVLANLPEDLKGLFPGGAKAFLHSERGYGLIEERITNHDGSPLKKVTPWLASCPDARTRTDVVDRAEEVLMRIAKSGIAFYDPQNLMVHERGDGTVEFKVIDCDPTDRRFVPFTKLGPAFRRLMAARRVRRFVKMLRTRFCAAAGRSE